MMRKGLKMSESKRFSLWQNALKHWIILDGDDPLMLPVWIGFENKETAQALADFLNELSKENDVLHETVSSLDKCQKGQSSIINQLYKENKELKQTADKKQKHIVNLEDKIHRMRKQIKKLEDLFYYRTVDIDRQYSKRIGIYEDFLKENDLSINWSEYCDCDECDVREFIECKDCFHLMRVLNK